MQRELARERLRDCKRLEFAEQKKIVYVKHNPSAALRAAPPLTQGRLRSAPPGRKRVPHGVWALVYRMLRRKESYRRNAKRKRGLFEKSPLLTPAKTFRRLLPECLACAPKAARQPVSPAARRFLKKAPFKSPKNFWATAAANSAYAPQAPRQSISPAARRFLKKAPFKSPKNFSATGAGHRAGVPN